MKEEYNLFSDITKEYIIKKKIQNDIDSLNFNNQVKTHVDRPKTQNELNKTQVEILKIATSMPITARDVMQKFNITREHASRMLSHLNKEGYLKKLNESKPYKYIIDDKGRQYLSDVY
jgi:predicted HTH transcriptional regulator